MTNRVLYEGMVHLASPMMMGVAWVRDRMTREPCVRFLCTGMYHPEKSAVFVHDDVDCMSCLVTQTRQER